MICIKEDDTMNKTCVKYKARIIATPPQQYFAIDGVGPISYYLLSEKQKKENEEYTLKILSGGLTKHDIGKGVYLSNTETNVDTWVVANVSEDGVDLFPIFTLGDMKFGDTNIYKDSHIRKWLNCELLNGFSEDVRNAMKMQSFESNGEILKDKVKCPSIDEMGLIYDTRCALHEGTIYPIFDGSFTDETNPLSKYITTNRSGVYYWTRSRFVGHGCRVWYVYSDGHYYYGYRSYGYSLGAVACIRF